MKRKIILFATTCFFLTMLMGCSNEHSDSNNTPPLHGVTQHGAYTNIVPNSEWTLTDGMTFRLYQDRQPVGTDGVTIIMENNSDSPEPSPIVLERQYWEWYGHSETGSLLMQIFDRKTGNMYDIFEQPPVRPGMSLTTTNPEIVVVAGTISGIGPDVEWSGDTAADSGSGFYIQLDYVERNCEYVDGMYLTSGTPKSIELFIDSRNTLILGEATIGVGAVMTVFYEDSENATRGRQLGAFTATAIKPLDYSWVQVAYFDEDFLSSCGSFSLVMLEDVVITHRDGIPFEDEVSELAGRLLAVYVEMSASPAPDAPHIHGIASSRIIVLNDANYMRYCRVLPLINLTC